MGTRECLLLALVFATLACGNGNGEDPTVALTREIKAHFQRAEEACNKVVAAYNQTAAIQELVTPFFTKDVVWTITSGIDTTLPTVQWVGTCSPYFYAGFKALASLAPVRFELAKVFFPDKYHAVYNYYVYSKQKGHEPLEFSTGYLVKSAGTHGKWRAQLVSVFEYRHATKYL